MQEFFSVIFGILSILMSFVSYYFYIRSELYKKTEDAVNSAEDKGGIGEEKLMAAAEQLYLTVPKILKPFITREHIKIIIQKAFDKIEEYAKKQVKY